MNLVDTNVLLYAVNEHAEHHVASKRWLDGALNGAAQVGFAWVVALGFVRLSTKVGLFPSPLPVGDALARLDRWLVQPPAVVVEPTSRHLEILARLLTTVGTGGNLTNDAHLAALAIEHRATIVSFDSDFARFDGVSWEQPPR